VLTPIMLAFGWRWMFVLMAMISFIFAGIRYAFYRDFDDEMLDDKDRHHLYGGREATEAHAVEAGAWGRLFSYRATWGLILGFFGIIYVTWLFITWLPGYLEMQRHISIPKTGFVASAPFLFGLVGSIGGAGWPTCDQARHDGDRQPQAADDRGCRGDGAGNVRGSGDGEQLHRGRVGSRGKDRGLSPEF
jgi:cyanate permease